MQMLMEDGPAYTSDGIYLHVTPNNNQVGALVRTASTFVYSDSIAAGTVGTVWHAVELVYDGAAASLYYDSVQKWTANITGNVASGASHLQFGRRPPGSMYYSGVMDEVRIESVARATNWIWACYMNMASNSLFNNYGAPENQSSINNAGGATNVTLSSAYLNGTLLATGSSPSTVFAFWGTFDGGMNAWANTNIWAAPQLPGGFTIQVTELSSNTTYYYRCLLYTSPSPRD